MLSKIILKLSLCAACITLVYCVLTDVTFGESLSRAVIVFSGFYFILIVFLVTLRLIFDPGKTSDFEAQLPPPPIGHEATDDVGDAAIDVAAEDLVEATGVIGE